jgi:hypothetical protein
VTTSQFEFASEFLKLVPKELVSEVVKQMRQDFNIVLQFGIPLTDVNELISKTLDGKTSRFGVKAFRVVFCSSTKMMRVLPSNQFVHATLYVEYMQQRGHSALPSTLGELDALITEMKAFRKTPL